MNLTLANAGADPDFSLRYSAKEAYNLASLTPQSWADVVWDMATNDQLFNEYQRLVSWKVNELAVHTECGP